MWICLYGKCAEVIQDFCSRFRITNSLLRVKPGSIDRTYSISDSRFGRGQTSSFNTNKGTRNYNKKTFVSVTVGGY